MERLIFSNPIPSKAHLNPSAFLPRVRRFVSAKIGFSSQPRTESRRFNSVCCKFQDSSVYPSHSTVPGEFPAKESCLLSSSEDFADGSAPRPHFLKRIAEALSEHQKAVSASTVVLLSAALVILLHPTLASPAFASFQTAAKTGQVVRTGFLSSAWTGFFTGCLHTLSGPDHLAALAPLSIGRTRMESAAVGALWGCGHDAGQLIFGLLFLLLKDRLHIEVLQTWGTRVVGFTLLLIGGMGIKEASESPAPCVALENGECDPGFYELMDNPTMNKKKKDIGFATFATGIVHGLQPDALMMVLPALALPSRLAGAAFLGMFLVGTVVSMGSYTVFIGSCSQALKERIPRITEKLTWASSLVAIALGFGIIISQYFGFSLY